MSYKQAVQLRSKIIGVLVRDARTAAGKSMKELGEVIGVSAGRIASIEKGSHAPSLPELEMLAFYLEIPFDHFWREQTVSDAPHPSQQLEADRVLSQRNEAIGQLVREGRKERGMSQKELGQQTQISGSRIRRYETGETPIPIPELEILAKALGFEISDFYSSTGAVGDWLNEQSEIDEFMALPQDLRRFLTREESRDYLKMAQKLSEMSPGTLRDLAAGLSELAS